MNPDIAPEALVKLREEMAFKTASIFCEAMKSYREGKRSATAVLVRLDGLAKDFDSLFPDAN